MNVTLFRSFPDQYRFSMAKYADEIRRRVGEFLAPGETIRTEQYPQPRLEGFGRYVDQYWRYGRWARRHAGDVNHVVDHGFGHLVRQLPAGRTIVTFHDAVVMKVPGVRWTTKTSLHHSLRAMRRAAAIVCVSEHGRASLRELGDFPDSQVHVIPWGIDEAYRPPVDRDAVRRKLGFSGPVVLMVGHTQPYMNIEACLRAVATLIARHGLDVTLVKVGLPFSPGQMRLAVELELSDRIDTVGRVAAADMPAYFQAADVLLYAPLLAGFGLPPLEAMACGTPVVASRRGSIPEVCGDAAVLVEADDDAGMSTALADVLSHPIRRRRLIDAGFARAAGFEWTSAARQLLELYRRVGRA
jgi:glycosyltransferase involved in cell wall biosynthesis